MFKVIIERYLLITTIVSVCFMIDLWTVFSLFVLYSSEEFATLLNWKFFSFVHQFILWNLFFLELFCVWPSFFLICVRFL
jgi:hypothetical protein